MGFDLLKTLGLKKSANKEFDKLKDKLVAEAVRAHARIAQGGFLETVVGDFTDKVLDAVGIGFVPGYLLKPFITKGIFENLHRYALANNLDGAVGQIDSFIAEVKGWRL